jgi:hypothetical protein
MKSSDDLQIRSVASRANRVRHMALIRLRPSRVDRSPVYGVLTRNRYSGHQSNSQKKSVSGNQWANVSHIRNCQQLTK